jgi:Na+-transporting methylmalonyl-CoA/oxaloacetate decarboxylase gamma subunit
MENLGFGLAVTVVGMGIVFGLLALMWLLLTLALRFEHRHDAAEPAAEPAPGAVGEVPRGSAPRAQAVPGAAGPLRLSGVPEGLDPRLVAAITVAVLRHTETRRRQAAPAMRSYWPGSLLFASRWVAAGRMRQGQIWRRRAR